MGRRVLPKPIEKPPYDAVALGSMCSTCNFHAKGCTPTKPKIVSNSPFIAVLDKPDAVSERHGEVRTTKPLKLLQDSLASSGATDVSMLYAVACKPPEGATSSEIQQARQSCFPRLENEIKQANAGGGTGELQWLLSLGQEAFESTTGKLGGQDAWLGSPVVGAIPGTKVIPTWPQWQIATAKGSRYAAVWVTHLDRYVKLATGQLGDFQWPEVVVDEGPRLTEALSRIASASLAGAEVSVDIETRGLGLDSAISCIGFASANDACCVQIPLTGSDAGLVACILSSGVMVGQNIAAFDRRVLTRAGYTLTDKWHDTMLAAAILDPQLDKNLGFLVNAEFHAPAHKAAFKTDKETGIQQGTWDSTDRAVERDRREYCLKDAYTTLLLWQRQKERLKAYGQQFYEELKELTLIALEMRESGIEWDFEAAERLDAKYSEKLERCRTQLRRGADEVLGVKDFNPGSTAQLRDIFYKRMKIPPTVWTEKGEPSTSDDALTEILASSDNNTAKEFAQKIADFREAQKILGTYVRGMAPEPGQTRVHGDWRAHTAVSGRWSCTGRPFQTLNAEMRQLGKATPGKLIVEADLPSAEVRTVMLFAGQDDIIDLLNDGGDLYSKAGTSIFNKPVSKKENKHLRQLGKLTILASHYGAGEETVFRQVIKQKLDPTDPESPTIIEAFPDLTPRKIGAIQRTYFRDTAPKVKLWMIEETRASGERGHYLCPLDGWKVDFYGPPDINFATNLPNQRAVGWWMNAALRRIRKQLRDGDTILTYIHDSLTLETPKKEIDRVRDLLVKEMEGEIEYKGRRVLMKPVEWKIGKNLAEVK